MQLCNRRSWGFLVLFFVVSAQPMDLFYQGQQPIVVLCTLQKENGVTAYVLNFFRTLIRAGHDAYLVLAEDSPLLTSLNASERTSSIVCPVSGAGCEHPQYWDDVTALRKTLERICSLIGACYIIANRRREVAAAAQLPSPFNRNLIYINHLSSDIDQSLISMVAGTIDVCPQYNSLKSKNRTYIPPFFDEERFLQYVPTRPRSEFFQQEFGIDIGNGPMLCMIANFYADPSLKNHQLLIRAVAALMQKERYVQVVFAGDGPRRSICQELVQELGVENFVHFLGTTQLTSELLCHAEAHVLCSSIEAFGIVLLESALMSRPKHCCTRDWRLHRFCSPLKNGYVVREQ